MVQPILALKPWKIRLYGKFELRGPSGELVPIATRKAEALLAILVINRKNGISRFRLCEMLWPKTSPDKQRTSLRQALAAVRRSIGPDKLELSGENCRLSDDFLLESDEEALLTGEPDQFLLGVEGVWAEDLRLSGFEPSPAKPEQGPISGLCHLLRWLSNYDSVKVLRLMRENISLVKGLHSSDLEYLASKLVDVSDLPGWKEYFIGHYLSIMGNLEVSSKYFRIAAQQASKHGDSQLLLEASSCLVPNAILQNRFSEALQLSSRISAISSNVKTNLATTAALLAGGLVKLHLADDADGFQMLQQAQDSCPDFVEGTLIAGLQAFFRSTYGQCDAANALIGDFDRFLSETNHSYLQMLKSLTLANVVAHECRPDEAVSKLSKIVQISENSQSPHFMIYSKEALAMGYKRVGDSESAQRNIGEVRKLRRTLCMSYTPWDEMRLTKAGSHQVPAAISLPR